MVDVYKVLEEEVKMFEDSGHSSADAIIMLENVIGRCIHSYVDGGEFLYDLLQASKVL